MFNCHQFTVLKLITCLGLTLLTACSAPIQEPAEATQVKTTADQNLTRGPAASEPNVPTGMVEIILKDKLDGNLSGYCFDIMGGGANIDPADGLQAHTCYSYRGALGSDQAVDPNLFANGIIKIVAFDVCATMNSVTTGSKLDLTDCDGSGTQQFIISESGTIAPASAPDMCLTAGEDTRFGRNGTSPHQIKTLTLEACAPASSARQEWRSREKDD